MIYMFRGVKGEPFSSVQILDEEDAYIGEARHITSEHSDGSTLYKFKGPKGIVPVGIMIKLPQLNEHTAVIGRADFVGVLDE